jgi:predicted 3-demethylubiquinone-9 3-methyltransferase (glyoxalase superfamily)
LTNAGSPGRVQKITPFLWFDGNAEEAVNFYVSVFKESGIDTLTRYSRDAAQASGRPEGSVMTVAFRIEGQRFVALNGGPHFRFSEAVSFVVNCDSQDELDYYWDRLAAGGDPAAQRCGWLKDRYSLSWQIVPTVLPKLLQGDAAKAGRVMQAIMAMGKLDIARLRQVHAQS